MKKLSIIIFSIFLLSSCFTNPEDVNNAKKDMGIIEEDTIEKTKKELNKEVEEEKTKDIEKEASKTENKNIKIEYLTEKQFLELDNLNYKSFVNGEAEISGTTLEKIDKIEVSFSNKISEFPDDLFALKQFKPGDKTFVYRAHTTYRVLDFGVNEYVFTAYIGDEISRLKLTVNVLKEEEKVIEKIPYEKIKLDNEEIILNLPSGGTFGHPISLGEEGFTYSDISGLEINKYSFSGTVNCESNVITDFLTEKIGTWFYWNTCRDIIKSKGISFYVIRLDGEDYFYEKHFLDLEKGLYGNYEIEKGTGVDKDNIKEKNNELKEKNNDILNIEIVNNLFKEIVK